MKNGGIDFNYFKKDVRMNQTNKYEATPSQLIWISLCAGLLPHKYVTHRPTV